jgi:hypothetical protein
MSPSILLFAGAPQSSTLDWQQHGLLEHFSRPFCRFLNLEAPPSITVSPDTTTFIQSAWRSLPLERQHLPTGVSQSHVNVNQNEYRGGASFFTTHDIDSFIQDCSQPHVRDSQVSSSESAVEVLSQFYEKSYATHEDVASSQLAAASNDSSSFQSDAYTSFASISDSALKDAPVAGHLTSLKDIPNAAYLNSIYPQTMTVNLIIGIISIPPPRAIKTRRGDNVELLEVLVGDETKSGFGINFWLPPPTSVEDNLRNVLGGFRSQDVILVRNVALDSFRGKVYGQSLRKNITKAYLLYRKRIDKSDAGGCYSAGDLGSLDTPNPQIDKTARVREWVLQFVGGGASHGKRKEKAGISEMTGEALPPDTQ